MSSALPRPLLRIRYEEAAEAYLRSLPPGHFMEANEPATQRKITLESLDLVHARLAAERQLAELRAQLEQLRKPRFREQR